MIYFFNWYLGRSLVFGRDTGISMDGHVLLNSGEVRHNWLDVRRDKKKKYLKIFYVFSLSCHY